MDDILIYRRKRGSSGQWKCREKSLMKVEFEQGRFVIFEKLAKADAKLIACTPDMLELLDFINDAINSHIKINKDSPLHDDIRNLLRRATE